MDAAITIQAQVRGFVERKRNMVLSSRKSEEIMKIPEEVIGKDENEQKVKIDLSRNQGWY